ncbi:hypothetical protein B0H67DRAFT_651983 [Lasiosphaeris hirsuta]|uniref:Uncharacterized protein n=1 Tax=Lasiosphaeris hirsuta TaxID=260670 RepID=A0AA40B9K8_9PEZI|nr:hypothetical protein B0H67DRAFT_651983 [Lasiosphaeris hirsuta]
MATRLGLFFKTKKRRDDLELRQLLFTRHLKQLLLPLVVDDDKIKVLLAAPGGRQLEGSLDYQSPREAIAGVV